MSGDETSKTVNRREVFKLAGTVAAFGAVLGFMQGSALGAQPGTTSTTRGKHISAQFKFFRGSSLLYAWTFPAILCSALGAGDKINVKWVLNGEERQEFVLGAEA